LTTPKKQAARKKVALHLEEYVPGLLTWLSNKLAASASQAYRQRFGLGIVEWRILAYLAVYDWGTGAQMSQLMGMDKAAISRGASFLQTKKFIKSRAGFGRNLEFGLTAKGQEIHGRIIRLALARQDALLSGLSKKDVSVLISHLHVLLNNLPSVDAIENREY
jgi:DNA-binding MarR family transcriptional regulator